MGPGPEEPPGDAGAPGAPGPTDPAYGGIAPDPAPDPGMAEHGPGAGRSTRIWVTTAIACVVAVAAFLGIRAVTGTTNSDGTVVATAVRQGVGGFGFGRGGGGGGGPGGPGPDAPGGTAPPSGQAS
jgi:hypothetical protein